MTLEIGIPMDLAIKKQSIIDNRKKGSPKEPFYYSTFRSQHNAV